MVVGVSRLGVGEQIVSPVFGNGSLAGDVGDAVVGDGARDVGGGVLRDGAVTSVTESSGNELETWALDVVGWSLGGRWRVANGVGVGAGDGVSIEEMSRCATVSSVYSIVDCVGDGVGWNVGWSV